ncbi:type II secretion system protein N [Chitinimonas lacunae]|uniref:Type II secretion system protein N n=1 Tax=Chitinimonas lacunae TaxID=1963018 RepID=A0ABV8MRR7_9NEIS
MKRLGWGWWLLLALLLPLCAVAQLPSTLLGWMLENRSQGLVKLAAADGTLWHGSGQLAIGDQALLERLRWQWQPRELLQGRFTYRLEADQGGAMLRLGWKRLELQQLELGFAAAPLVGLDRRLQPFQLGGRIRLASPGLTVSPSQIDGGLTVDWQQASSPLVPTLPQLGDYRAVLSPQGDSWQFQVQTLNGQLQLDGGGNWSPKTGLHGEIGVRAAPGAENLVGPLLAQIGPGAPTERRRLKLNVR